MTSVGMSMSTFRNRSFGSEINSCCTLLATMKKDFHLLLALQLVQIQQKMELEHVKYLAAGVWQFQAWRLEPEKVHSKDFFRQ